MVALLCNKNMPHVIFFTLLNHPSSSLVSASVLGVAPVATGCGVFFEAHT